MTGAPVTELEYKPEEKQPDIRKKVLMVVLEEADMATYLRIWVVPRVFNLVPETLSWGWDFLVFSEL
ncbi:hypothetical protein DFQ00_104252 [Paenibacillus barcinonensis]|uniref:Uncharacterized protein n=1 Tax=Paenibacillus barcinonensis TaxID=198119 RepID=A0A2V4WQJ7_PAEBA|nr:hypothetical protein DFQ00_104252 [Paenibacillus barcinonensis]